MVMTVLMALGAVGAVLPLLGRGSHTGRVRSAHLCMGTVMAAMVVFGTDPSMALISILALVAAAVHVTADRPNRTRSIPCAVDLTCMAVLLMMLPPTHSHAEPQSSMRHQHGVEADPRIIAALLLVGWMAVTIHLLRTNPPGRRVTAGSALMVLGMAPMAF
ncbi:hypothetical protein CH305_10695 [Rhodococcus sp. 15-649-2-2]|uniref:DUF5134 domain-containing protein n=1 Tax=Rhodococcus sp. 15-649-2-2 TaxID=2023140 RepID=UPI000B9AEBE9|nr:DUF5134 domain-containing protein [Rhodococcus sp. 15-649-2-2]OZE81240.1 hypothetical protein CH305_10695 [Rhodococcus sp. 15-649-2-2]